jgi:hypothetical protein
LEENPLPKSPIVISLLLLFSRVGKRKLKRLSLLPPKEEKEGLNWFETLSLLPWELQLEIK